LFVAACGDDDHTDSSSLLLRLVVGFAVGGGGGGVVGLAVGDAVTEEVGRAVGTPVERGVGALVGGAVQVPAVSLPLLQVEDEHVALGKSSGVLVQDLPVGRAAVQLPRPPEFGTRRVASHGRFTAPHTPQYLSHCPSYCCK
jgi:hypothetical protein